MEPKPHYDGEIAGRTAALTTLIGYLVGQRFGWPVEVSASAGALVGPIYDAVAFWVKKRLGGA